MTPREAWHAAHRKLRLDVDLTGPLAVWVLAVFAADAWQDWTTAAALFAVAVLFGVLTKLRRLEERIYGSVQAEDEDEDLHDL